MYNTNSEDNMSFDFYESRSKSGVVRFFPDSQESDELLEFLGVHEMYVDNDRMDKIYNWLNAMGHECYVESSPQRSIRQPDFKAQSFAM